MCHVLNNFQQNNVFRILREDTMIAKTLAKALDRMMLCTLFCIFYYIFNFNNLLDGLEALKLVKGRCMCFQFHILSAYCIHKNVCILIYFKHI